jgi:hypothetical protein
VVEARGGAVQAARGSRGGHLIRRWINESGACEVTVRIFSCRGEVAMVTSLEYRGCLRGRSTGGRRQRAQGRCLDDGWPTDSGRG